jgi:hypothetical protein
LIAPGFLSQMMKSKTFYQFEQSHTDRNIAEHEMEPFHLIKPAGSSEIPHPTQAFLSN